VISQNYLTDLNITYVAAWGNGSIFRLIKIISQGDCCLDDPKQRPIGGASFFRVAISPRVLNEEPGRL
jgi:hypothetical protein